MKIETREKFPNFVGFVSGVDLKKELNDEIIILFSDIIYDFKDLKKTSDENKSAFANAKPFPHIEIENFFKIVQKKDPI